MNKPTNIVLIIDDEPKIRRFLRAGFELHGGFSVYEAESAAAGLKAATFNAPDLIILDLALPDLPGAEVLELIRSWSNVPIIVLSVQSDEEEKVRLLELGADDYVVKPFGIAELIARSHAALRRYFKSATESPVVTAGPLSIDLVNRTVLLNNSQIKLTRKQYRLLHVLATHVGLVVTHDQLLKEIWSGAVRKDIQYLRILVRNLRQIIEPDVDRPQLIVTESGVGYRLQSRLEDSTPAQPVTPTGGMPDQMS
jgi:two-component system, OmpR family, KDP operon response regulator KdpE